MQKLLTYFMVTLFFLTCKLKAETWSLAPIKGDKTKQWAVEPNWTWNKGNPMKYKGAKWTVAMQDVDDPELTGKYTPMEKGDIYGFKFGWRGKEGGKDPQFKYMEKTLSTYITLGNKKGPAAAVIFKPAKAGKFKVDISGNIYVQNKTAGYALVTVYVLSKKRSVAKELKAYKLNLKGGHMAKELSGNFAYQEEVAISAGEELAIRVQTVNPGPASAGRSGIKFKNFTITKL